MKPSDSFWKSGLKLPKSIWALGLVSLLMDASSEMVHGLLPVFLVSVLGASYTMVGLIEGIGEATAVALKVFSGPFSDWIGKRKPLVLVGYSVGALSKPLFALAQSTGIVLGARIFDRVGKGIRGAPRDALIADIADPEVRGAAFGLRQSLDTVGAVLGPLLAIIIMSISANNFRLVFWLAVIPGLLCVLLILAGVQEPERKLMVGLREKRVLPGLRQFPTAFWVVAVAGGFSQLARFSEAFLLLRATDLGLPAGLSPVVLIAINVVYALIAFPVGWLSDRMPREYLVGLGFLVLAVADLFLAFGSNLFFSFIGMIMWGLHMGLTQGTLAAMVADYSPSEFRGTGFGIFNLFSALALLLASAFAGVLWDQFGPQTTFLVAAMISLSGALVLLLTHKFTAAARRNL